MDAIDNDAAKAGDLTNNACSTDALLVSRGCNSGSSYAPLIGFQC